MGSESAAPTRRLSSYRRLMVGPSERVRQQMDAAAQRGGYHYHFYVDGWGCQVV